MHKFIYSIYLRYLSKFTAGQKTWQN